MTTIARAGRRRRERDEGSQAPPAEVVPHVARRVHSHPAGWEPKWRPPEPRRESRIVMAVDALAGPDGAPAVAGFVVVHADAPAAILRAGLVTPPEAGAELVREVASAAAQLGWPLLSHRAFVREIIGATVWRGEATLTAYDLDRVLGLLSEGWTATRDRKALSLAFGMAAKRLSGRTKDRGVASDAYLPSVTIRARDGRRQGARFGSNADHRFHSARLIDVVQLCHAQSGRYPRDLSDLCVRLGLPPPRAADGPKSVAERSVAISVCYALLLNRHRSLVGDAGGGNLSESPGWYGRRWLELMGLAPPLFRWWGGIDQRLLGSIEAYFGPEVLLFQRAAPVAGCYLFDVLSEFLVGAANIGVWSWLTAERLEVVDLDPGRVRAELGALGERALGDPKTRREWGGTFLALIPDGEVLPHRVPKPGGGHRMKVAPLCCPEPSLWNALDVIRSVMDTGRPPGRIVSAWRVRPVGKLAGLRPLELPWGTFDPNEPGADFFRWCVERRVLLQAGEIDPGPDWTPEAAAAALKACAVAIIGSLAQVISGRGRRSKRLALVNGDGSSESRYGQRVEAPGAWYFPPVAAAILAEGRLTGYAARRAVRRRGGRPLYSATDSVVASGLSPKAALAVQRDLEPLNPTGLTGPLILPGSGGLRQYPHRRGGSLLLRITSENFGEPRADEHGETYLPRVPITFCGWRTMHYVLADPAGRLVKASEHGLGDLVEVADDGLRRFPSARIGAWLCHMAGLAPEPPGMDAPRLVIQSANRPRVSEAFGGPGAPLLRPGEPLVLAFEHRPLRLGERMIAARAVPGFEIDSADWRTFGSAEPVRVVRGENVDPRRRGVVRLQTVGEYLDRYTSAPQPGTADAARRPCRTGTTGPLFQRPTIAKGVRRTGKEAHDVGEWVAEPTRPADFGPSQPDPEGHAVRLFRDACRVLGRRLHDGGAIAVYDGTDREIPGETVRRAIKTRTAPPEIRRGIIAAAATAAARPSLPHADAISLLAAACRAPGCSTPARPGARYCAAHASRSSRRPQRRCSASGCDQPAAGRSTWCSEHRAQAARQRSRRYRARKKAA